MAILIDDIAQRMFGGPAPEGAPSPRGNDAEIADKLFGDSTHAQTSLWPDTDLTIPLAEVQEHNQMWRSSLRAMQFSEPEGRAATELFRQYLKSPADEAQRAAWRRETSDAFSARYGSEEGRARIATADALAKKDSRFAAMLAKSGLGSHPRLTEILADRAHSARLAGKL